METPNRDGVGGYRFFKMKFWSPNERWVGDALQASNGCNHVLCQDSVTVFGFHPSATKNQHNKHNLSSNLVTFRQYPPGHLPKTRDSLLRWKDRSVHQ